MVTRSLVLGLSGRQLMKLQYKFNTTALTYPQCHLSGRHPYPRLKNAFARRFVRRGFSANRIKEHRDQELVGSLKCSSYVITLSSSGVMDDGAVFWSLPDGLVKGVSVDIPADVLNRGDSRLWDCANPTVAVWSRAKEISAWASGRISYAATGELVVILMADSLAKRRCPTRTVV